MALAFGAIGASNAGTTSLSVAYPSGISAGDLLILAVGNKYPTNGPSTPSGWTAPANNQAVTTGGGAAGAGTGDVYTTVFTKTADGSESGSLTVTVTSANVSIGVMWRVTKSLDTWDVSLATGADDTGGTTVSITANVNPGLDAGDLLYVAMTSNIGNRTYSSQAVTATGVSVWGTVTDRSQTASTTGDDASLVISEHPVTTGTASAAPVFTATASGGTPEMSGVFIRIRETSSGPTTEQLVGTSAGTSTTTGMLTSLVPIAGASAGASQTSGTLKALVPVVGTSAGTSTDTGALGVRRALVGTSAGTSTGAALLSSTVPVAGTSEGESDAAGTLSIIEGPTIGTIRVRKTGFGGLRRFSAFARFLGSTNKLILPEGLVQLDGAVSCSSAMEGTLSGQVPIEGVSANDAEIVATLAGTITIVGADESTSETSGLLGAKRVLAGTSAGTSATTGALTIGGPLLIPIAGVSAGTSAGTGVLSAKFALAGTSAGTSVSAGMLKASVPIAGTSAGTSSTRGNLIITSPAPFEALVGTSAGTSSTTGVLTSKVPIAGASAGTSATAGAAVAKRALAGASAGISVSVAALTVAVAGKEALIGTSFGAAVTTGMLTSKVPIAGVSACAATTSALLKSKVPIAGTSAGTSAATGFLSDQIIEVPFPMAGANNQRTSWVSAGPTTDLNEIWAKPIEAYVSPKIPPIGAGGKVYVSTSHGLYAFDADTGAPAWVYPTELPLGHAPTYDNGVLYVGGMDRKLHAINAVTGAFIWSYTCGGGITTNPLVQSGVVYWGARDGVLYAVKAQGSAGAGTPPAGWTHYQADSPIDYSPAYQDGIIYFGTMGGRIHAINATTGSGSGSGCWTTAVLPGQGFRDWWPVVHGNYLIVNRTAEQNNEFSLQDSWLFSPEPVSGSQPGNLSTDAAPPTGSGHRRYDVTSNPWGANQSVPDYFATHPLRRSVMVLNRTTGAEITWNLTTGAEGGGQYAPIMHAGKTVNLSPAVVGPDGTLYFRTTNWSLPAIPGAMLVGWKLGSRYLTLPASHNLLTGQSAHWPQDEPVAFSMAGTCLYWNVCSDRGAGLVNTAIPNPNFPTSNPNAIRLVDGRQPPMDNSGTGGTISTSMPHQSTQPDATTVLDYWQALTRFQGRMGYLHHPFAGVPGNPTGPLVKYHYAHGTNHAPMVYDGKLYLIRSNALIAFGNVSLTGPPGAGTGTNAPVLAIAPKVTNGAAVPDTVTVAARKAQLAAYITKTINAGNANTPVAGLRSGWFGTGLFNVSSEGFDNDLMEYWHNPADDLVPLLRARAILAADGGYASTVTLIDAWVVAQYQPVSPFGRVRVDNTRHVGFSNGASRDGLSLWSTAATVPAGATVLQQTPTSSGKQNEAHYVYAMWKWYQTYGGGSSAVATSLWNLVKSVNVVAPLPTTTTEYAHRFNRYIAYIEGYLAIWAAADSPTDAKVATLQADRTTYRNLRLNMIRDLVWGDPADQDSTDSRSYYSVGIHFWNFLYMVPELADWLIAQGQQEHIRGVIEDYCANAPHWMMGMNPEVQLEDGYTPYHQQHALFQARAMLLGESQEQLARYLDAPLTRIGDSFWIDNACAALEADSTFSAITDNTADYPAGVPAGEMVEVRFQAETVATNTFFQYRTAYPPGIVETGVTCWVDWTTDNWATYTSRRAWYGELMEAELEGNTLEQKPNQSAVLQDWLHPSDEFCWRARFTPSAAGTVQYRLRRVDASGEAVSSIHTLTAIARLTGKRGRVTASTVSPRYLVDASNIYYPSAGINIPSILDRDSPSLNADLVADWYDNGLTFMRHWLMTFGFWGAYQAGWNSPLIAFAANEPQIGLFPLTHGAWASEYPTLAASRPTLPAGEDFVMWLNADEHIFGSGNSTKFRFNPVRTLGYLSQEVAVEEDSDYLLEVSYKEIGLEGPITGSGTTDKGLVVKRHTGTIWSDTVVANRITYPGQGTVLAATYASFGSTVVDDPDATGWKLLSDTVTIPPGEHYIPRLSVLLENCQNTSGTGPNGSLNAGHAVIRDIRMRKIISPGVYGPNVIYKSHLSRAHTGIADARAYAADIFLQQCHSLGINILPVVMEKNDQCYGWLEFNGTTGTGTSLNTDLAYGDQREYGGTGSATKVRFLQECLWSRIDAQFGWAEEFYGAEALNEGPAATKHYEYVEGFSRFWQTTLLGIASPDDAHPAKKRTGTSFDSTGTGTAPTFFANSTTYPYANNAHADQQFHRYVAPANGTATGTTKSDSLFFDAAEEMVTYDAARGNVNGRPVIRGEYGLSFTPQTDAIAAGKDAGLWWRHQLFAGLGAGGVISLYWGNPPYYAHTVKTSGSPQYDYRPQVKTWRDFMTGIPRANGNYTTITEAPSNSNLRVVGQKDIVSASKKAHVWIQNRKHTWASRAVVNGATFTGTVPVWDGSSITGTLTLTGFAASTGYTVERWEYSLSNVLTKTTTSVTSDGSGNLVLNLSTLINSATGDVALKIGTYS